ncbi:MAG: hypothetical protein R3C01_13085 [Planctomycetaceae bacterium]
MDDWKISITFYDTVVDEPPMSRCLPIRTRWPFDFSRYVSATNLEKKRMMLEGLHAASLWVAEQMCWNTAPLQAAYETLLKADCEWSYVSKKQWLSPDRTLKVRVAVDLDIPMHHLMLNVYQPRTESIIKRIPLRLLHPINSPSYFNVKNGRWVSNDQFAFQDGYHPETFVDFPPLS